jgi:hypothetical protein
MTDPVQGALFVYYRITFHLDTRYYREMIPDIRVILKGVRACAGYSDRAGLPGPVNQ